jgi:cell wall-associated NlpC family hydrolase
MAQEAPTPSASSSTSTASETAPLPRHGRATRFREWLQTNAVFFELAGGIIIALASATIAFQANRISEQQTNLLSQQTTLMDLAYQPALVVYADQTTPDSRGRPTQSIIVVSSFNAAVGEITARFTTYVPVCRTAKPPDDEASFSLVTLPQMDVRDCKLVVFSGFYDHIEYSPASTGEVARLTNRGDSQGNLGTYFALSDQMARLPSPNGTYPVFGPMMTYLTIDYTSVKQTSELHFLVGVHGQGVKTSIQYPERDEFTWEGGGTSWRFPVSQGQPEIVAWKDLETQKLVSLLPGEAQEPPTPDTKNGQDVADYATEYLGYPYVWATKGPASFDASGFTNWVILQTFGIDIGTSVSSQFGKGVSVEYGDLQPGDLVFFQNTYTQGLSHVGIYIGNGQFIHAENEISGVRISDITSSYYATRYFGARRLEGQTSASPTTGITPESDSPTDPDGEGVDLTPMSSYGE